LGGAQRRPPGEDEGTTDAQSGDGREDPWFVATPTACVRALPARSLGRRRLPGL